VSVVNQAIEDGIDDGRIPDVFMPVFQRKLAGNESGAGAVAIFDDFQQVSSFRAACTVITPVEKAKAIRPDPVYLRSSKCLIT
jgi:hypothetical protein